MNTRIGTAVLAFAIAVCFGCSGTPQNLAPTNALEPALPPQSVGTSGLERILPGLRAMALAAGAPKTRMGSWAAAGAAAQHVYVADPSLDGYYGAVCYYGAAGGAQLGCLAGGPSAASGIDFPEGTWIDGAKHLFVANGGSTSGYTGQVTEYALPLTSTSTPINTLYSNVTNPSQGAILAYVCGDRSGNIYGTTLYSTTIAVWKSGTMNGPPTSTLSDAKLANVGSPSLADGPVACATDRAGNLFVSGQFAVGSTGNWLYYAELDEFPRGVNGSGKAKVLQRETSDLYFPAGVAIDKQGNLAWALFNLSDSGSNVCTYPKPYTGTSTACTSGFATGFHFTEAGTDLWGGDTTTYPWYHQPQEHMANEIGYPGGGPITSTSGTGLITPVDASVNLPSP